MLLSEDEIKYGFLTNVVENKSHGVLYRDIRYWED